jgi:hypothetical protein
MKKIARNVTSTPVTVNFSLNKGSFAENEESEISLSAVNFKVNSFLNTGSGVKNQEQMEMNAVCVEEVSVSDMNSVMDNSVMDEKSMMMDDDYFDTGFGSNPI